MLSIVPQHTGTAKATWHCNFYIFALMRDSMIDIA
jgi:hypothetical protein